GGGGHSGGAAGDRDDRAGAGGAADDPAEGDRAPIAVGGDPGLRHGDLLGQDGDLDPEQDDGHPGVGGRPAVRGDGNGLRTGRRLPVGEAGRVPPPVGRFAAAAGDRGAVQQRRPGAGGGRRHASPEEGRVAHRRGSHGGGSAGGRSQGGHPPGGDGPPVEAG